jgi:hypothetical protein
MGMGATADAEGRAETAAKLFAAAEAAFSAANVWLWH